MKELLFIDLDNTLIESLPFLEHCYKKCLSAYGLEGKAPPFKEVQSLSIAALAKFLHDTWIPETPVEEIRREYDRFLQEGMAPLKEGVLSFLSFLTEQRVDLVLVSAAPLSWIEKHLLHHSIRNCFSQIEGGEKRSSIEKVLKERGILASHAALIDDDFSEVLSPVSLFRPDLEAFKEHFFRTHYVSLGVDEELALHPVETESPLSKEALEEQERIFTEKKEKMPHLFNGPVLFFEGWSGNDLFYSVGEYKTLIASHVSQLPELRKKIPMAVAGKVFFEDKLLVGRRSDAVAVDSGLYELVPQGVLPLPDPWHQFVTELEEEANISEDQIQSVNFEGVILDLRSRICEFVFEAHLLTSEFSSSEENSELFFKTPKELESLGGGFNPFSHYLLSTIKSEG